MAKKTAGGTKDLPGMEDRAIKDLHEAAIDYDTKKKARMAASRDEVEAKGRVRDLMHKHKRTKYAFDGVSIELEPPDGEDKVKVRITTDDEPQEDE